MVTFVPPFGNCFSHKGILRTTLPYEPFPVPLYIRFKSCFTSVPSMVIPMLRCSLFF